MAETPTTPPTPDLLDEQIREDPLLQIRMAVVNVFLGYWKHGLGVIALGLVGVFIYGTWTEQQRDAQREHQAAVSLPLARLSELAREKAEEEVFKAEMGKVAEEVAGAAGGAEGSARTYGFVQAALLQDNLEQPEKAAQAWEQAAKAGGLGILGWVPAARHGQELVKKGDLDGALALWRPFAETGGAFEAQEALFLMGSSAHSAARADEAKKALDGLTTRFPNSPRKTELEELLKAAAP